MDEPTISFHVWFVSSEHSVRICWWLPSDVRPQITGRSSRSGRHSESPVEAPQDSLEGLCAFSGTTLPVNRCAPPATPPQSNNGHVRHGSPGRFSTTLGMPY